MSKYSMVLIHKSDYGSGIYLKTYFIFLLTHILSNSSWISCPWLVSHIFPHQSVHMGPLPQLSLHISTYTKSVPFHKNLSHVCDKWLHVQVMSLKRIHPSQWRGFFSYNEVCHLLRYAWNLASKRPIVVKSGKTKVWENNSFKQLIAKLFHPVQ